MKYLILAAALGFGIISIAFTQGKKPVPAAVQAAFKAKFPTVQKAKWDNEDETEWEAEFKMDGKEMSANFKEDGTWLETEAELKAAALPQAVKDAIASQFAGYKIEEVSLVETPELAAAYEVELEMGEADIEALFGADGLLIKQETETEDDEDRD